jgi:murein DD-endopeptidase MepM/ murein hydrolase activator NlpD
VSFAGTQSGYGNIVIIEHPGGVTTAYAHMSRITVVAGDTVARGERIGDVGNTGRSTGSHMHFEIRVNGIARNPRLYLKGDPARV